LGKAGGTDGAARGLLNRATGGGSDVERWALAGGAYVGAVECRQAFFVLLEAGGVDRADTLLDVMTGGRR
jgi:hypothetical protein